MDSRIKGERANKSLSQEQLAKMIKVSRPVLAKWEQDIDTCPIGKAVELSILFDCTVDYLIGMSDTRR